MFLLHEQTQKSLCRIGFVAFCIVPTCAVALWAAARNSESHRIRCETELSRLLGLKVMLGSIEYPEPRVVRYRDFALADPEHDVRIASAALVELRTTDTTAAISAASFKLEIGAGQVVAELLHRWLRDRTTEGPTSMRINIDELVVVAESGDVSLMDISARLEPTTEGRGAQLMFRTAQMTRDTSPAVLTIVRSRHARIGFELDTHGAFDAPGPTYSTVVQVLRRLVGDNEVLAPVTAEAEKLLRVSL